MLLFALVPVVAIVPNVVGAYRADYRHMRCNVPATARTILGNGILLIGPQGRFSLRGEFLEGTWRWEGEQLVLRTDTFMGNHYDAPPDTTPPNNIKTAMTGMVFERSGKDLVLVSPHGAIKWRVPFRPTQLPTWRSRLKTCSQEEIKDEEAFNVAWYSLQYETPALWRIFVVFASDPRAVPFERVNAGMFLATSKSVEVRMAAAKLLSRLRPSDRADQWVAKVIVSWLSEKPFLGARQLVCDAQSRGLIPATTLAAYAAAIHDTSAVPTLDRAVNDARTKDRRSIVRALGKIGDPRALDCVRGFPTATAEDRMAVDGAILRLSPDQIERDRLVQKILRTKSTSMWGDDRIEVLGDSRSRLALPFLVYKAEPREEAQLELKDLNQKTFDASVIQGRVDHSERLSAIEGLGKLGFKEALPCLMRIIEDQDDSYELREAARKAARQIMSRSRTTTSASPTGG